MVRILMSIGLVLSCTGLPAQAKGSAPMQPSAAAQPLAVAVTTSTSIHGKVQSSKVSVAPSSSAPAAPVAVCLNHQGKRQVASLGSKISMNSSHPVHGHLARLTAYWASEGDYYTRHGISSTGIRLHDGHCAVDPRIIPYGSLVNIPGVGTYLAVDTGSAVISRTAARLSGHTAEERSALVIDLYFESRVDGQQFQANEAKYTTITWKAPNATNLMTEDVKNLIAEEDWNKLRSKQL